MIINVIGSGSAFSKINNTSSIHIVDKQKNQWLVDCGPTVPRAVWQNNIGINDIDAIYFTHIHPDHSSGLAALINQWKSFNRTAKLDVFCQHDQQPALESLVELAIWPETELCFDIHWHRIEDEFSWKHWEIQSANTQHEMSNRALRLTIDDRVLFYSGDGRPTPASEALMQGSDIAFQECASFEGLPDDSSHGDLLDCIRLLDSQNIKALGIYHCFDEDIPKLEKAVQSQARLFISHDCLSIDLNSFDIRAYKKGSCSGSV